jgi:hypothetical protein
MKVIAKEMGYYNHGRIKPGTVFELKPIRGKLSTDPKAKIVTIEPDQQFSDRWMEKFDPESPLLKKGKKNESRKPVAYSELDPKQVIADEVI